MKAAVGCRKGLLQKNSSLRCHRVLARPELARSPLSKNRTEAGRFHAPPICSSLAPCGSRRRQPKKAKNGEKIQTAAVKAFLFFRLLSFFSATLTQHVSRESTGDLGLPDHDSRLSWKTQLGTEATEENHEVTEG